MPRGLRFTALRLQVCRVIQITSMSAPPIRFCQFATSIRPGDFPNAQGKPPAAGRARRGRRRGLPDAPGKLRRARLAWPGLFGTHTSGLCARFFARAGLSGEGWAARRDA